MKKPKPNKRILKELADAGDLALIHQQKARFYKGRKKQIAANLRGRKYDPS